MVNRVSNIIGIDISGFFLKYINFIDSQQQQIRDYYTIETPYPKESFDLLDLLLRDCELIYSKVSGNRSRLTQFSDFEVIDKFEDVVHALSIINNLSRWLRSSMINGRFKNKTEVNFILKQNQTLESLSEELGYSDRDKGLVDLSIRNSIKEIDYTLDGGLTFKFNYESGNSVSLFTVIDNITGERVLGKDLDRKLSFGEEDLVVLTYQQTFLQTCEIFTGLLKRDNPEFSNAGFDKMTISNRNVINNMLPTFLRQLYSTVSSDDTIASFNITNVSIENDKLNIEIVFRSYIDNQVKQLIRGN